MRESDAEKIAEIYNEYVLRSTISFETERVTTEEMRRRIVETAQKYPYLVYEEEDEVKAYCYAHRWKEREATVIRWKPRCMSAIRGVGKGSGGG